YPSWLTITAVRDELQEITNYVAIFSDITARKKTEQEIHHLAFYDALTELPNRRLFQDRFYAALNASERHKDFGAVLFIDMDKFKSLNDTLGHDYGDLLLIEVGVRIKSCIREMDTVARYGGDEFVVLIEGVSKNQDDAANKVARVAEKIRESLARPYQLKEHQHRSSPSIGICLYHGNDASMAAVIEQADMAMYEVKKSGRNAICFFDPLMQSNVTDHHDLVRNLQQSIELNQLQLHYQIQVDSGKHPLGAEAFLRWDHPVHGLMLPGKFIPLAEESTLILAIDQWVLKTACRQLAAWSRCNKTRHLTLTVNISAKQFGQPDFVSLVAKIVREHGVSPDLLKLELSERVLLENMNRSMDKIRALKELGIRLSMDNSGTVFSSLSYLSQISSDQLKINQDFVQGVTEAGNDAQLVRTIVGLARSLDMDIFAEGVETEAQRAFLQTQDCRTYQGYLFGRPVAIEQFDVMLGEL
ncbi:MAG: EAL domain-containing protein, partial [Gallionella sp.]|nr:EAL domain-containing protein [Gallionella sp.]